MADIGLIGLAVMGQNLVLNMSDKGYSVSVYNRTEAKTREFLAGPAAQHPRVQATYSIQELVASLDRPRKVMLLVKAGAVVDAFIEQLLPHLEPGDIVIDGGNSHYPDSNRRADELAKHGILFVGTGVSGGEEGARHGPSLMPGGNPEAWQSIREIFQAISAKAPDGAPCADWVGPAGSGHYVKMVHNGIEYGDMQLISEAYHFMKTGLAMSNEQMQRIFLDWNSTELDSFLIEITAAILGTKESDGSYVLDGVLDTAGQKGTGKWTGINALDEGIPVTLIVEAVFARSLSARKEERVAASGILRGPEVQSITGDQDQIVEDLRVALLASKIVSYAQGFMLIRNASEQHDWKIDYGSVAGLWRAGCIIRSGFLGQITAAFSENPGLNNLLLAPWFTDVIHRAQAGWRRTVGRAIAAGIPVPAFATALAFYDGFRCEHLPANMIQAQRDYFGAHTFERIDRPRGEFVHFDWAGTGGNATSGTYNA